MALDEIPELGDDAFVNGALSKGFMNRLIKRCNLWGKGFIVEDDNNYGFDASEESFYIKIKRQAQLTGSNNFPFRIFIQPDPNTPGTWDYGVSFNSPIFPNANITNPPGSLVVTTGFLTSATPTPTDTGWIPWNKTSYATDPVWIEGTIGSWPSLSSCAVNSYSKANSNTAYGGGDVENDGGTGTPVVYTQTKFRALIGIVTADANGNATILPTNQFIRTALKLQLISKDSFDSTGNAHEEIIPAIYPFPYPS